MDAYIIAAFLLPVLIFGCSAGNVKSAVNNKGGSVKSSIRNQLNREQANLNRLTEEAMGKGTSPGENEEILEKSMKENDLINKYHSR